MGLWRTWHDFTDALARAIEDATVIGRLRVDALRILNMPLDQVAGDELEKGIHRLLAAMSVADVDWSEAERRIVGGGVVMEVADPDQSYFRSPEWQAGERESEEARLAGEAVRFDSDDPDDIVRWLRTDP
jgi:hypothetical protein